MAKTYYDIRLDENRVQAMKAVARRKAFEEGRDYTWVDVLRRGVDMVLKGEPEGQAGPLVLTCSGEMNG